ncbi:MAG: LodA/GoxA family CTQ-dependent oxidase [Nannocystaceae bacterium]
MPASSPVFRIHPAIGVARVGDAPREHYFLGPEVPGVAWAPDRFKVGGRIRPQAARFRVWTYVREGGLVRPDREAIPGEDGVLAIRWRVHLANRKAAFFAFSGLQGEKACYHGGRADLPPKGRRNDLSKAPGSWVIDPGPRVICGANAGPEAFTPRGGAGERWPHRVDGSLVIDDLGELRTDEVGRLVVIGGRGASGSSALRPRPIKSYANNPTWFDDVADGPVTAEVQVKIDGEVRWVPVEGADAAWVVVGPPDFAPDITGAVTLYDVLCDLTARRLAIPRDEWVWQGPLGWLKALHDELHGATTPILRRFRPDFARDVFPILERAANFRWVFRVGDQVHVRALGDPRLGDPGPDARPLRVAVFSRLRPPGGVGASNATMPMLLGDDPYKRVGDAEAPGRERLTLTPTQYAILERWRDGEFERSGSTPTINGPRRAAGRVTPHGLDQAALEGCTGGAFYPGIEVGWQIRHHELYAAPFRIRHGGPSSYVGEEELVRAGHFTRQMAVPWQADFLDCKREGRTGWWPSQRPDVAWIAGATAPVHWARVAEGGEIASKERMVAVWSKLGVIVRRGDEFHETERDPSL